MKPRRSLLEYLLEPDRGLPRDPLSRLAGFADGFWAARYHLGAADPLSEEFFRWLDQRGEPSTAGWWAKLSQECAGDQVAAAQKLRELITEFLQREKGTPTGIKGTLFELLADMRKWIDQDFNPGLPERKLARLAGYINGYLEARIQLGAPDMLANEFFGRLAERGAQPPEGWEERLLRDCNGDEVAAIRIVLDKADEFTEEWGLYSREWVEAARAINVDVETRHEEGSTWPVVARFPFDVRQTIRAYLKQGGFAGLSPREYLEKMMKPK